MSEVSQMLSPKLANLDDNQQNTTSNVVTSPSRDIQTQITVPEIDQLKINSNDGSTDKHVTSEHMLNKVDDSIDGSFANETDTFNKLQYSSQYMVQPDPNLISQQAAIKNAILYMPRGKPIISTQKTSINDLMYINYIRDQKSQLDKYHGPLGNNHSILKKNNLRIKSNLTDKKNQDGTLFKNNKIQQSQMSVVDRLTQEKPHQRVRSVLTTMASAPQASSDAFNKMQTSFRNQQDKKDLVLPNLNQKGLTLFQDMNSSRKYTRNNFGTSKSPSGRSVHFADKRVISELNSLRHSPRFQQFKGFDTSDQVRENELTSLRSPISRNSNNLTGLPNVTQNGIQQTMQPDYFKRRSQSEIYDYNQYYEQVKDNIKKMNEHRGNSFEQGRVFESQYVNQHKNQKSIKKSKIIKLDDLKNKIQAQVEKFDKPVKSEKFLEKQKILMDLLTKQHKQHNVDVTQDDRIKRNQEQAPITFDNLKKQIQKIEQNNEYILKEMLARGKIYTQEDDQEEDATKLSQPDFENEYQQLIDDNNQKSRLKKLDKLRHESGVAKEITDKVAKNFTAAKTKLQLSKMLKSDVKYRESELTDYDIVKPQYKMINDKLQLVNDYGQRDGFVAYKSNEKYYINKRDFDIQFGLMPEPESNPIEPLNQLVAFRRGIKDRLSQINEVEVQLKDYQLQLESKTKDVEDSSQKSDGSEQVANLKMQIQKSMSPKKVVQSNIDLNNIKQVNSDDSTDSFFENQQQLAKQNSDTMEFSILRNTIKPNQIQQASVQEQGQITNENTSPFKLNVSMQDFPNSAVTLDRGMRASQIYASPNIKSDQKTDDGDETKLIQQLQDSPEIKQLKDRLQNLDKNEDTENLRKQARNIKKQTLMELKKVERIIKEQSEELLAKDSLTNLSANLIQKTQSSSVNQLRNKLQSVSAFDQQQKDQKESKQKCEEQQVNKDQRDSLQVPNDNSKANGDKSQLRLQVQSSVLPLEMLEAFQEIELPPDDHLSTLSSIEEIQEDYEDQLKQVKLNEVEIENMPVLKGRRDKDLSKRIQNRKISQWQTQFDETAQKHIIENENFTRSPEAEDALMSPYLKEFQKKQNREDMNKLEMLETKIKKYNDSFDHKLEYAKLKLRMKQQYITKRNVITRVFEDDAIEKNMQNQYTLLNKMAMDQELNEQMYFTETENSQVQPEQSIEYSKYQSPSIMYSVSRRNEEFNQSRSSADSFASKSPRRLSPIMKFDKDVIDMQQQLKIIEEIDQKEKGMRALIHYQQIFSNIPKLIQDYKYAAKEINSPLIQFLICLEEQNIKVNPKTYGFLIKKDIGQMNLQSFLLSDIYINAFVKSLNICDKLRILNLSKTGLTTQNSILVIQNLPKNLRELNMSDNNQFGPQAAQVLSQLVLNNKEYNLIEHLNLEGCNIGNVGCAYVCAYLRKGDDSGHSGLRILNLSKNNISKKGGIILGQFIRDNKNLTMILLHWNPLGGDASEVIARGLQVNQYLQVLDLSFCALGAKRVHKPKVNVGPAKVEQDEDDDEQEVSKKPSPPPIKQEEIFKLSQEKPSKVQVSDPDPIPEPQFNKIPPEEVEKLPDDEKKEYKKNYLKFCEQKRAYKHTVNKLPFRKKPYIKIDYCSAAEWSKAFQMNNDLIHLDLSHNNFDTRELQIMNEGLNQNQTLFGLHIKGNEGFLDAQGFIKTQDRGANIAIEEFSQYSEFKRIQPLLKMGQIKNPHKKLHKLNINANCWICEGWQEYDFQFKPKFLIDPSVTPVKLHLSCDNFEGYVLPHYEDNVEMTVQQPSPNKGLLLRKMQTQQSIGNDNANQQNPMALKILDNFKNQLRKKLSVTLKQKTFHDRRHLPPGSIFYYYTVNGKVILDDSSPQINIFGKQTQFANSQKVDARIKNQLLELKVPRTNFIAKVKQSKKQITHTFIDRIKAKPRPKPFEFKQSVRQKSAWDVSKSIFKSYRQDNEETLNLCFETDWSLSKCDKVLRENKYNIKMVKDYLRQVYKYVREAYKNYSGLHPLERLTCVSTQAMVECLKNCMNLIDNRTIKLADIDLQIIACNSKVEKKRADLNPEKTVVRYQFLEVLVRLAIDKYFKTGECKMFHEAVIKAFEVNYINHFNDFDSSTFRWDKLYKEENDVVLTRLSNGLRILFMKICQKASEKKKTAQKYIHIDDFQNMMIEAQLFSENVSFAQIGQAFAMSMQTNVNEVESDAHLTMNFHEFIEAIARCADKFQLEQLDNYFPENQPKNPFILDKKIECVVLHLIEAHLPSKIFEQTKETYAAAINQKEKEK